MSDPRKLFKLRRAKDRINDAKVRPVPKMLFGEFWLENELCILFADTGKGKSILAVQIAESIARGEAIFPMQMTAPAQKVLYFDFELSDKQFEMRYAADAEEGEDFLKDHYDLHDNFYTAEIDSDGEFPEDFASFEEYLRVAVKDMICEVGAKVVIIDNITYLRGANDTAREAIPLMRELKRLKKELGLSILVLAHTPKRSQTRPLTVNDLQGSKVLSNFADNVFAIGQSGVDSNFRYVKHIKTRSTEMLYDDGNVLVGEIAKWKENFLGFKFYRFSKESNHLTKAVNPMILERAKMMSEAYEDGMSQREIAAEFSISVGTVNRYLQMTRTEDGYYDDDEEEVDLPEDWPEDPEERFQRSLKMYNIPDPPKKKVLEKGTEQENLGEEKPEKEPDLPPGPVKEEEEDAAARDGPDDKPGVEDEPSPVRYKEEGEEIEIGDIVRGRDGVLRKRTRWGWDYSADAIK